MKAFRSLATLGMLLVTAAPALAEGPAPAYVMIIRPDGMSTIGAITRRRVEGSDRAFKAAFGAGDRDSVGW